MIEARERALRWLRSERDVSLASASIKEERKGRVDPVWEGPTADEMLKDAETLELIIAFVEGLPR